MFRDDTALFAQLGLHAIATLYDLQTVESGDVHQLAVLYTRLLGALWLKRTAPPLSTPLDWAAQQPSTPAAPTLLTPECVIETLQAVFIVERIGISHPQRVEFLEFFERPVPAFGVEVRRPVGLSEREAMAIQHSPPGVFVCVALCDS